MRRVRPPLIELRQYVIAPGRRDRMIELFDTYFAAAQDALGLPILGQFRAVGDADRLVWLRGFDDMATRPERLGAFYGGPVWTEFGPEAIGYVAGYDNVQLLREAAPGQGIEADLDARPPLDAASPAGVVVATTYRLRHSPTDDVVRLCGAILAAQPGLRRLGLYVSEPSANNFPALPIREGEHLLTWLATPLDPEADPPWPDESSLAPLLDGPPERLVLEPTARSVLRGLAA
jgi:hypothetical protein